MRKRKSARHRTVAVVVATLCVAAAIAAPVPLAQADEGSSVVLEGGFGAVTVSTERGMLSDLRLRAPDGSLPSTPLTMGPIDSAVVAGDGHRFESRFGSPQGVAVGRYPDGRVRSVRLEGVPLLAATTLPPVVTGGEPGSFSEQSAPNSVAFSPDGETAYATSFFAQTVVPFDPATGAKQPAVALESAPTGIAVAPDGTLLVAATSFTTGAGSLIEIDPASGQVVAEVEVGSEPQFPAITPDGATALVPNHGSDSVSVVDVATLAVTATIPVGPGPVTVAMAPSGDRAYVTNLGSWSQLSTEAPRPGSDTVTPIDLGQMQALAPIAVGDGPFGAAVTPDGEKLVVSLRREHSIVLVDTATGAVSAPIDVGLVPGRGAPAGLALSPDGGTAYVYVLAQRNGSSTSSVTSVDLASGESSRPFPLSPVDGLAFSSYFPNGVAVSPDGRFLLSVAWNASVVNRFDLAPPSRQAAPVTEDWTLSVAGDGSLRWKIDQSWSGSFDGSEQAEPSLQLAPDTVSTVWYQPDKLLSRTQTPATAQVSEDFFQVLDDDETWATYQLWSPYRFKSDLRMKVSNGYLTHYLSRFGNVSRVGTRFDRSDSFHAEAGESRELTLKIGARDQTASGYQLQATVPDEGMLSSLRELYDGLANGGVLADQGHYWFGDQAAGMLYVDSALMTGQAISAGTPGNEPASAHPHSLPAAFRGFLAAILASVDADGKVNFGFSAPGQYGIPFPISQDQALQALAGLHDYVVHTGDLQLFGEYRTAIERVLGLWISRIDSTGLVLTATEEGDHYDQITCGATTCYDTYINVLVYQVLREMAELEQASARLGVGDEAARATARSYRQTARRLKRAINARLWTRHSPHGPMYADWLDAETGEKTYVFMGSVQYPAIEYGVANRTKAQLMLETADQRLDVLEAENGYTGAGTLVNLWPIPEEYFRQYPGLSITHPFGVYENGGMLLRETHDEVVARAMSGDADGARERLAKFAQQFEQTSWWGDNGASINGEMEGGSGEPYAYGAQSVPGSLVEGLLGVEVGWKGIEVDPAMPAGWTDASAEVMYRGARYCVRIEGEAANRTRGRCSP